MGDNKGVVNQIVGKSIFSSIVGKSIFSSTPTLPTITTIQIDGGGKYASWQLQYYFVL